MFGSHSDAKSKNTHTHVCVFMYMRLYADIILIHTHTTHIRIYAFVRENVIRVFLRSELFFVIIKLI